jgi:hypothetical protein
MGQQMRQNVVNFLLHSLEIYDALYLFYIALCAHLSLLVKLTVRNGAPPHLFTSQLIPKCSSYKQWKGEGKNEFRRESQELPP